MPDSIGPAPPTLSFEEGHSRYGSIYNFQPLLSNSRSYKKDMTPDVALDPSNYPSNFNNQNVSSPFFEENTNSDDMLI